MTEPIIINCVDVSECEYFVNNCVNKNGCNKERTVTKCEIKKNCYYKQLKKTQQELQQAMDNYVKATNYYEDKLAQIKRIIKGV